MSLISEAKGGADLTHPRASVGWVVGAIVAVVLLAIAVAVGLIVYRFGKTKIGGSVPGSLGSQSGMGASGDSGWL